MAQATNVNYFGINSLTHLWAKIKAQDSSLYEKLIAKDASLDASLASYAEGLVSDLDTSVGNALDLKVDKVEGKGLSTNDFTDDASTKLKGIEAGAQVNVIETVKINGNEQSVSEKEVDLAVITGVKLDGSLLTPVNGVVDVEAGLGTFVTRADFDSSLAEVDGSIGDLKTKDTEIDSSIVRIDASLEAFKSKDEDIDSSITALKTKDTQIDASLSALITKDGQIDSSITALKAKDENIDSSIVALQNKDTQIDASLAELIAKDGQIDSSIVRLDGRIDALGAALKYKGTKQTYEELPTEGNEDGDVWNVVQAHGDYPAGTNYAWDGSDWDPLGGAIDTSAWLTNENMIEISDASIDAVCV